MKKSHILGVIVIAVAIGVITTTAGDASSYVSFNEARLMANQGSEAKIHVVGTLKKNNRGEVIDIFESPDKLSFKFLLIDQLGNEQEVLYAKPIPQDFDRSEQVVVVGSYYEEKFVADKILLKCPSKYQEEKIEV